MIGRYCVTLVAAIALATSKSESAPTQSTAGRNEGERHTVVVDPAGRGDSTTIQGGIDLIPPGGRVKVLPGTYPEALVIGKGLTLEGVARRRGAVLVAPSGTPTAAVQVTTSEQVTLRNLTVHSPGANGIGGQGTLDLTIERVNVLAINPSVPGNLIVVVNNGGSGRATLVVVDSHVDGAITGPVSSPQVFGIRVGGDIDAWLVGNEIRRTGGACIVASPADNGGGHREHHRKQDCQYEDPGVVPPTFCDQPANFRDQLRVLWWADRTQPDPRRRSELRRSYGAQPSRGHLARHPL